MRSEALKKRKISEFVRFVPGINPTRARKQYGTDEINYYDQAAFERDYNHKHGFVEEEIIENILAGLALQKGDVVISNSMQLATMVGDANAGKVPSLNFTKVEFCDDRLDKRYFIYLFNSYRDIRRQKERELQGNGPILRIPIKSLKKLEIPVISLEKQAKIGRAYIETLKLQAKLNTYGKLVGEFTERILEESIVKEKKDEK